MPVVLAAATVMSGCNQRVVPKQFSFEKQQPLIESLNSSTLKPGSLYDRISNNESFTGKFLSPEQLDTLRKFDIALDKTIKKDIRAHCEASSGLKLLRIQMNEILKAQGMLPNSQSQDNLPCCASKFFGDTNSLRNYRLPHPEDFRWTYIGFSTLRREK